MGFPLRRRGTKGDLEYQDNQIPPAPLCQRGEYRGEDAAPTVYVVKFHSLYHIRLNP